MTGIFEDICVSAISMSAVLSNFYLSGQSVHSETLCFSFCRATISCPLNRVLVPPNRPQNSLVWCTMRADAKTLGVAVPTKITPNAQVGVNFSLTAQWLRVSISLWACPAIYTITLRPGVTTRSMVLVWEMVVHSG